jgi:hypothetical protein
VHILKMFSLDCYSPETSVLSNNKHKDVGHKQITELELEHHFGRTLYNILVFYLLLICGHKKSHYVLGLHVTAICRPSSS